MNIEEFKIEVAKQCSDLRQNSGVTTTQLQSAGISNHMYDRIEQNTGNYAFDTLLRYFALFPNRDIRIERKKGKWSITIK